jgi:hypothetical protein
MSAAPALNRRDLDHYFEYSGVGLVVEKDGLAEVKLGELMVERGLLNREQLFRALMEQDRQPETHFGELVVALGFCTQDRVDELLAELAALDVIEVD